MKRIFYTLTLLLLVFATSCGKKGIYLYLAGTQWKIESGEQAAYVGFMDDDFCSAIQVNYDQAATQTQNGTYTAQGHNLDLALTSGNSVHMIRTFSHIKNSNNKNLKPMKAQAPGNLIGSVWAVLSANNLYFAYFGSDEELLSGRYYNITRQEGLPYKWMWSYEPYTLNSNQISSGKYSGTFYEDQVLALSTVAVSHVSDLEEKNPTFTQSSLTGTAWVGLNGTYPIVIIFTSDTEFTRIMVSSSIVFAWKTGTYKLHGSSLTMAVGELTDDCTIANDSFVFFERKYTRVDLESL